MLYGFFDREGVSVKWQNKGHEFDQQAEQYIEQFRKMGEKICIFGAGYLGGEVRNVVERLGCFAGYIDNDIRKQKSGVYGSRVFSIEEYTASRQKSIIVIAVDRKHVPALTKQLTDRNFSADEDFFVWDDFLGRVLPILMAYEYDLLYVELAQISVTERCSLHCRKCAHACNYVGMDAEDMTIGEICHSADVFFSHVDLCREFVLIGGEPLLHSSLSKAVSYIGKCYRDKMIHFCITTNGTIMPDEQLMQVCREYQVLFRISNYSGQLPHLAEKYNRLTRYLEAEGIQYVLGSADENWMDYGFETVVRNADKAALQKVFDDCRTPCREIRGSRYYYCVMARSVSENMGIGVGKSDFLDLEKLTAHNKKILMEFGLGYSEKGYLDMCGHCNGADAKKLLIPAAEQG